MKHQGSYSESPQTGQGDADRMMRKVSDAGYLSGEAILLETSKIFSYGTLDRVW